MSSFLPGTFLQEQGDHPTHRVYCCQLGIQTIVTRCKHHGAWGRYNLNSCKHGKHAWLNTPWSLHCKEIPLLSHGEAGWGNKVHKSELWPGNKFNVMLNLLYILHFYKMYMTWQKKCGYGGNCSPNTYFQTRSLVTFCMHVSAMKPFNISSQSLNLIIF